MPIRVNNQDMNISAESSDSVLVIGAGIAGLATALRLAHAGMAVTVLERGAEVGGKMRTLPSDAGPVDAGPTVLTMRPVFEELFESVGETLSSHLTLIPETILARHWWHDGSTLDLHADPAASEAAIEAFAGPRAASDFRKFSAKAKALYEAFDAPMMQSAAPSQFDLTLRVLRQPSLIAAMAPHLTLAQSLNRSFKDKRLAQLFGRYATYVGGSPFAAPALLGLIAHSEARGVWRIEGGMHRLARTLRSLAQARGARFITGADVTRFEVQQGRICAAHTANGTRYAAGTVVFNGDPRALNTGLLGNAAKAAVPTKGTDPRSLSAYVYAFAATPEGPELTHHNVFFARDPRAEFDPIAAGHMPDDPTLYICAQDRGTGTTPAALERFEIIMNGPPRAGTDSQEKDQCQTRVFETLAQFGLTFTPRPPPKTLTTPEEFNSLFPASQGSLYGRSPHGLTASLARPTARSRLPGLYLAGGGAHPGAGIPMATLSARHAAEAILQDRTSTSTSQKTVMRGGMSTASPTMANAPSRSSVS